MGIFIFVILIAYILIKPLLGPDKITNANDEINLSRDLYKSKDMVKIKEVKKNPGLIFMGLGLLVGGILVVIGFSTYPLGFGRPIAIIGKTIMKKSVRNL